MITAPFTRLLTLTLTQKRYNEAKTVIEEALYLDFPDDIRNELELIFAKIQINWI